MESNTGHNNIETEDLDAAEKIAQNDPLRVFESTI